MSNVAKGQEIMAQPRNRFAILAAIVTLGIAAFLLDGTSGVFASANSLKPALSSQHAAERCLAQLETAISNKTFGSALGGPLEPSGAKLVAELSDSGGYLIIYARIHSNIGLFCSTGGLGGQYGLVQPLGRSKYFSYTPMFWSSHGRVDNFRFVAHVRKGISSVVAVLYGGKSQTSHPRFGLVAFVISGRFPKHASFPRQFGELIGFDSNGKVVATLPLGLN